MPTTASERWAKYTMSKWVVDSSAPWIFWGIATISVASFFFLDQFPLSLMLVVLPTITGLHTWERNGVKRLLDAKDAEIEQLRTKILETRANNQPDA
jgi:hypothetical protein